MVDIVHPGGEYELHQFIAQAAAAGTTLEVGGRGSKRGIGRPVQAETVLSTERISGITLYEPSELVISARAGTPVHMVEATLSRNRQQLAFEPIDLGPVMGEPEGQGSIGAVFASNLSGSRRVLAGAARDHFLGVRAINGRGELFKAGGRVLKNVTGYDLTRGITGSWGTLAVMSEVTMKVLPAAEAVGTLLFEGLTDDVAIEAMCEAMATPYEVSGALHLQGELVGGMAMDVLGRRGRPVTALRLETYADSIDERVRKLGRAIAEFGEPQILADIEARSFWAKVRKLQFLQGSEGSLWRISLAPRNGARLVAAIARRLRCRAAFDWSGGVVWLIIDSGRDAGATEVRRCVGEIGGHATLIRAEPAIRSAVDVFQTLDSGTARLTAGIKAAFDPEGILNPGRMYAGL